MDKCLSDYKLCILTLQIQIKTHRRLCMNMHVRDNSKHEQCNSVFIDILF